MPTITIGNRSFETPVLVPSISSFETQLQPISALRLQAALQEPISLISAYDVWLNRPELVELSKEYRKRGVLLLDSGGYESSRISHYARETELERWDFSKYVEIAREDVHDFIFSFDYFLKDDEPAGQFTERILQEFKKHADVLDSSKLIPVVHIQTIDAKRRLTGQEVIELFSYLASHLKCRFIAIPERELGAGITVRAHLVRNIAAAIQENSSTECSLHILGCGNLLSFSLLAVAGALMCDGLEWCRTFAADHFHLHHFQQRDVFADPGYHIGNPIAEFIIDDPSLDYRTSVAVRNLLSFQVFTRHLHDRLGTRRVHEFVREHFGNPAGEAIRALEA
jgi:hypothetical protein